MTHPYGREFAERKWGALDPPPGAVIVSRWELLLSLFIPDLSFQTKPTTILVLN